MEYIDIHSHLNFPDFDVDREAIIAEMKEKKIGAIVVGTTFETSKKAVEIAQAHENIWAIVGCHPIYAEEGFNYDAYKQLAQENKVVGIGECGLDYKYPNNKQREVFEQQIALAQELNKPLMLHIRDAYKDVYNMLKDTSVRANAHFFAGSIEDTNNFLDLGYTISFTGVITFTHDYDHLVKHIPNDRIMSETDSPYVSPKRGQRNTPLNVVDIVAKMADLRGETLIHMKSTILDNFKHFFI
jgi:TatD DNase family protein